MSGSALCCAWADSRFEEAVPVSCIGLILALFVFGLAGALAAGVYAVLAAALLLWAAAGAGIRKKGLRPFAGRFFTPGFWLYLLLAAALLFCNYGRLVATWDDFTHWADVVRVITELDDFGTNPGSHSLFPEYAPGTSLFLYFLQKLILLFKPQAGFTEWALFYAHQLLFFAVFLPFAKELELRRPSGWLLLAVLVLLPLTVSMHDLVFQRLTVDTLMSALYAGVLAFSLMPGQKNRLTRTCVCLELSLLSLLKGLGLLFSLSGAAVFLLMESRERPGREKRRLAAGTAAAALLPWLLWELHVRLRGCKRAFSLQLDGFSMEALLGEGQYRLETLKSFIKAFLERNLSANVETNSLRLTPVFLLALLMTLLFLALRSGGKGDRARQKRYKTVFWFLLGSFLAEFAAICLAYLFSFSQWEATSLASYERYIGSVFLSGAYLLVLLAANLIRRGLLDGTRSAALALCAVAALSPWSPVLDFAARGGVTFSREFRQPYEEILSRVEACTGGESSRIFLISADSVDKVVLRYALRPHTVQIDHVSQPEFVDLVWDGGVPTGYDGREGLSPAQAWMADLRENYDYVLIFYLSDGFPEKFGAAFAEPEQIRGNSLYRVDRDTGLLSLCE